MSDPEPAASGDRDLRATVVLLADALWRLHAALEEHTRPDGARMNSGHAIGTHLNHARSEITTARTRLGLPVPPHQD
jgi:hypothetical protein